MGRAKDLLIEEDDRWEWIAAVNGYKCTTCGFTIPKSEYVAGESECGWCRHEAAKND